MRLSFVKYKLPVLTYLLAYLHVRQHFVDSLNSQAPTH